VINNDARNFIIPDIIETRNGPSRVLATLSVLEFKDKEKATFADWNCLRVASMDFGLLWTAGPRYIQGLDYNDPIYGILEQEESTFLDDCVQWWSNPNSDWGVTEKLSQDEFEGIWFKYDGQMDKKSTFVTPIAKVIGNKELPNGVIAPYVNIIDQAHVIYSIGYFTKREDVKVNPSFVVSHAEFPEISDDTTPEQLQEFFQSYMDEITNSIDGPTPTRDFWNELEMWIKTIKPLLTR